MAIKIPAKDLFEPSDGSPVRQRCRKCGRWFDQCKYFVGDRGQSTFTCWFCRKSSNRSHKRRRERDAAERRQQQQQRQQAQQQQAQQQQQVQQQQSQQQQAQQQRQQPPQTLPMPMQSPPFQVQPQQQQQNSFVAQTQGENDTSFAPLHDMFDADSQNAFISSYDLVPTNGMFPPDRNATMPPSTQSQSSFTFEDHFADNSSTGQFSRNGEFTNTPGHLFAPAAANQYTNHLNSLFVANSYGIHARMPAIVPRVVADFQDLLDSDVEDLTSATPFAEHSNHVTIALHRGGQMQHYDVKANSQFFLERAE